MLDLGDKSFLMPGLIDTHVHLSLNADDDPVAAPAGRERRADADADADRRPIGPDGGYNDDPRSRRPELFRTGPGAPLREHHRSRPDHRRRRTAADHAGPREWDGVKEIYRRLQAHGARMVAGTDAGIARFKPHDVLPYAFHDLMKIGMTPVAALTAMTSEAADLCGLAGRKGVIRPGADADLLVLSGNPISDLSQITAVAAVFRHGTRVR